MLQLYWLIGGYLVCAILTGCAKLHEESEVNRPQSSINTTSVHETTSIISRVEYEGLVAEIEQLAVKDNEIVVSYQIQKLASCRWMLKPQGGGVVQFYDADKKVIGKGTRVSVKLNFERLQQGLPSKMEFTASMPKDARFVTVWYGVDEFETHLFPIPRPTA